MNGSDRLGESIVLLAEAVLRVLRVLGRTHGCLLVLEDLHWADPDTMAIVEYLADNLASEPVVCLGTLRPGGSTRGLAVASSLTARRAASSVELSPLGTSDVAAMARACLELTSLPPEFESILQESADGLPFLVRSCWPVRLAPASSSSPATDGKSSPASSRTCPGRSSHR